MVYSCKSLGHCIGISVLGQDWKLYEKRNDPLVGMLMLASAALSRKLDEELIEEH